MNALYLPSQRFAVPEARAAGEEFPMGFRHPDIAALPRNSLIIGDRRIEHGSGQRHEHVYPGTGRVTREISLGSPADVDEAVSAARAAFPAWRALPGDKRRDLMFRFAELCEQNM